jgi:peptidase YpeB-like protein
MTRIFIPTLARAFIACMSAQAREPSAEARAAVAQSLAEIGCTSDEIEIKDSRYEAHDAKCMDGRYDITLDKDFVIIGTNKAHD